MECNLEFIEFTLKNEKYIFFIPNKRKLAVSIWY